MSIWGKSVDKSVEYVWKVVEKVGIGQKKPKKRKKS